MKTGPLLFAIPQLPTEWFCLISPLLLRPLSMPVPSPTILLAAFVAFGSIECLKVSWGFQIFMISKFHCANKIINPQCVGRVVTFQNGAAFVPEVPIEKAAWTPFSGLFHLLRVNYGPWVFYSGIHRIYNACFEAVFLIRCIEETRK